uniref:E3 ubiquitin-protein ligase n=1 Tax=Hyaloperonospora arabidopsidis (strain Emoy2) TaxID=559515 RepID=M4C510_HYAAE
MATTTAAEPDADVVAAAPPLESSTVIDAALEARIVSHCTVHVIIAAHATSHDAHVDATAACSIQSPSKESELLSNPVDYTAAESQRVASFSACVATHYGSVKRLKCEEVWHGDHMAYRCRTCGLSDSSCMCLTCFDPDEHEGHDYRVYRCSSGGCCDCGDALAWKPQGFCKKHCAEQADTSGISARMMDMGAEEYAVVQMVVRKNMGFCVETLRLVYAACLKPRVHDRVASRKRLPRTGVLRASLLPLVKVYVDRMQETLTWLQMLSMSCLQYRKIISDMFFEELPAEFHLDGVVVSARAVAGTAETCSREREFEEGPIDTMPLSDESDDEKVEENALVHEPLLMIDVFLKAGVLLPVETCDVLGVLYLKLLFDQSFKQMYTCHFVEWYPYFIELYLAASDANNEDGMRNLSRFIDRLFCQLFHSNAQLRELETVFASTRQGCNAVHKDQRTHGRRRRRRHVDHVYGVAAVATDLTPSSCVEWLMVFLLEKLNDLFRSTLRLMTILPQPCIDGSLPVIGSTNGSSISTAGLGTEPEAPSVLRTVQTVDCGRNVYKKRIYARLCSDLRTLLVHPQIAAEVLLRSFRCIGGDDCALHKASVFAQLMKAFELLQQMDLQTRHIHQHIEYESQNWTYAFVADYELKLLLSAFLTGVPACFSREVWQTITADDSMRKRRATGVMTGGAGFSPLEMDTFRPVALARAILQPVREALAQWINRNGMPELTAEAAESHADRGEVVTATEVTAQLVKYYEQGTAALSGASAKSFHFPLNQMYAALIHALCGVVRPQTLDDWRDLLGMGCTDTGKQKDMAFWYSVLNHPLRVLLFSREIKAGLWTRNGGVMLQQLVHYHSKHWRFFGLHSDVFLCQLGAVLLPHGSFTRLFFHHLPFGIRNSSVLGLSSPNDTQTDTSDATANADRGRELRQELDIVEEALRLLLQLVLAPVKLASASSPDTAAVWLLEREIMHWLTLGPSTRSEVVTRTDMKLVEQIKQLSAHKWAELEEEEILTHVLENVGVYDEPAGNSSGSRTTRSGSLQGYGLKMSVVWKLKPELWSHVSPLFECFTPSEAQQCEQNIRKYLPKSSERDNVLATSIVLPTLPRAQLEGESSVGMHALIAKTMLNSSYMASALFIIFENYKRKTVALRQIERGGGGAQDSLCSYTNENLLLAALHCLYVAVEMLPKDTRNHHLTVLKVCTDSSCKRNLDDIANCFDEESSLFVKLCTDVPVESTHHDVKEVASSSLLSLLLFFGEQKNGLEDSCAVVNRIFQSVREKSPACSLCLDAMMRSKLDIQAQERISGSYPDSFAQCTSSDMGDKQPKLSAKEMMRRRQQQILEKMRSQQMQFLSSSSTAAEDGNCEGTGGNTEGNGMEIDTDSDSAGAAMESDDEMDEDHEEEDEWGFPTGQVSVSLYLDHVSSAIAQMMDKQRRCQDWRRRRRRSTRTSSISVENDHMGRLSSASYDYGSMDDHSLQAEECGLCRLSCDSRSRESSFGFVGMILPTNMLQKVDKVSPCSTGRDICPLSLPCLPSRRVLKPGTNDEMRMQLADSVIWSCGHAIHHSCLTAYLKSLWEQKHGRGPVVLANGDNRLLSKRDMEFLCPICRRLSNCLVPCISLGELRERASTSEFMKTGFGSEEEEEEEEKQDDGQDPLAFLPWLDAQMSFRDDSPVVKRRRSRTQSSMRLRRRLQSATSKSSLSSEPVSSSAGLTLSCGERQSPEPDKSVEGEISAFCQEIVLRCVRAQLYLPTLLTSSIRDEGSLDLEMQQLGLDCGAQTPAWQLLLHCLEVQLRVVVREKTLLQTDAVDPLQLRSMRQVADLTAVAVASTSPNSLTWTTIEAPAEQHFESIMTRLNGLIFGQQVLFEEDDAACHTRRNRFGQLESGDFEDTTDAALVGTPMLCHPRLLTCFALRLVWRQRIATLSTDVAAEQLLTEAFFSTRVLFTAQVLQSLAHLSMQDDQLLPSDEAGIEEETNGEIVHAEIRDFDRVESLRDASAWISSVLVRCRLVDSKSIMAPRATVQRPWNITAMEEQVSMLCLPLAQQMLLLMDVMSSISHQHFNDSQGSSESKSSQVASESCAVCEGLYPSTSTSTGASALLDKCLRRLHLPPLRLFFHRQMFPSSQRALCQLWGAQLEAKAAVSRQQARSQTQVTGASSTLIDAFPLKQHVMLLSSRATSDRAKYRMLISLPRVYMDLFIRYNEKPMGVCRQCDQRVARLKKAVAWGNARSTLSTAALG